MNNNTKGIKKISFAIEHIQSIIRSCEVYIDCLIKNALISDDISDDEIMNLIETARLCVKFKRSCEEPQELNVIIGMCEEVKESFDPIQTKVSKMLMDKKFDNQETRYDLAELKDIDL